MDKVYNEKGEVAVLISPGYGAGWSTWNTSSSDCMFNPELVRAVLNKESPSVIDSIAERLYGDDFYTGGAGQLEVVWLPKGTGFRIHEYDGYESIVIYHDNDYFEA